MSYIWIDEEGWHVTNFTVGRSSILEYGVARRLSSDITAVFIRRREKKSRPKRVVAFYIKYWLALFTYRKSALCAKPFNDEFSHGVHEFVIFCDSAAYSVRTAGRTHPYRHERKSFERSADLRAIFVREFIFSLPSPVRLLGFATAFIHPSHLRRNHVLFIVFYLVTFRRFERKSTVCEVE